ncbi:RE1 [Symbiodinium natans]|uniref:E3 ubiquitin-protein ligase listerin n=1 Tax=Symbiodinium natans TaxID=878477 RepID=A0A812MZQ2_9DINO|nr:RE1 [Symbiodinium natans]
MREYERRVRLFESSTGIDPSYRAQKLMEKLSGQAWLATESIDLDFLKHPQGVDRLLKHLWQELEPLEHLKIFTTLTEFYKDFRRGAGQEFVAFDLEFRAHLKRLEEIGGKIDGVTKAYWFLEKAGLSMDLRKQVVAAAGGEYDYTRLRKALMAIVPKVRKDEDQNHLPRSASHRQWKPKPHHAPRQVHATMDGGDGLDEEYEDEETGQASENASELEGELEVLLTQAARKRAEIEKARGFAKTESSQEREQRIKQMKAKMPCSACKAHGKTVYGHWHSDATCPYNKKNQDKSVLAVVEEQLTDSASDDEEFGPDGEPENEDVFVCIEESCVLQEVCGDRKSLRGARDPLKYVMALSDTCCARTVAGERWMRKHMHHLHAMHEDVYIVDEARPFRFGGGPRVMSSYAAIIPLHLQGAEKAVQLRVSIVDQDVPLLLSKAVLKHLGAVMNLAEGTVRFAELNTTVQLRETKTGLCGFEINKIKPQAHRRFEEPVLQGEDEIIVGNSPQVMQNIMSVKTGNSSESPFSGNPRSLRQECEDFAKSLLRKKDFTYQALLELARHLPTGHGVRHRNAAGGKGPINLPWIGGLYVHGNKCDLTKKTVRYPNVVRYINTFMRDKVDHPWTSFYLARDVHMQMHMDSNNRKGSKTTSVTFGHFQGGELWVELGHDEDSSASDVVWKQDLNGISRPGRLTSTFQNPREFDPHLRHATHEWTGERWCLSVYSVRETAEVDEICWKVLSKLKFPYRAKNRSRTFGEHREHEPAFMSSQDREPLHQSRDDMSKTPQLFQFETQLKPEDFVQAIAARCQVKEPDLRQRTTDRLKEIWAALKPKKYSVLPANWRKFDVETLKQLYAEKAASDLGRDLDGHWSRWKRSALILELEMWVIQVEEAQLLDDQCDHPHPVCPTCKIPMMVRTNRLSRQDFYGCLRFPNCKCTLPMTYDGRPTKDVQQEMELHKIQKQEAASKPMNGKRGPNSLATSSDGSWAKAEAIPVDDETGSDQEKVFNANVSKDELQMIIEKRQAKNGAPTDKKEVRSRIKVGQARRAHLKKGVIKRLLGNAKALTAAVCITSAALLGAAIQAVPSLSRARPDLLEIHDGQVKVAKSFSRWGWRVYDSVDVRGNFGDREAQEDMFQRIEEIQPRLIIMSNCCPRNPPVYGGTRNRSQEERRAKKWRERQKAGVELVERVFKSQIDRGDHALAELPLNSTWGVRGLAGTMLNHPNVKCVHVKRDVDGVRNDNDAWVTNCEHIANELEKIDRLATARGNASRNHERSCIAQAICVGYVNNLKECDPGRVRKLLRSLSVRIRNKVRTDDRDIHDLRWNEKNVAKALKRWHAVFAQEGEIEDDGQSDEEMIPHSEEPRDTDMGNPGDENVERSVPPTEQVKSRLSTEGIAFEVPSGKHLSEGVREGLIKAHCNLGHPSPSDLERFLKLGGARQDVVEAVRWMKCLTCAHSRRPSTHRVSSIPPCQVTFGDEVQLDCICIHDSNKESFWYLSILDRATSYHILELLRDHTPLELHRAFDRAWMKWAGPPLKVTVDLEGGFQGRQFWEEVTQAGTSISAVAGTAHWQAGKVERHNQTVKDMLMGDQGSELAHRMRYRYHAKMEFIKSQVRDMLWGSREALEQEEFARELAQDVDVDVETATSSDAHVHAVYQKATQSKNKLKKMMEKEIPFDKIPQEQRSLYKAAEEKEWNSWLEYDSCEILSPEASEAVEQERPERILPSRYVFRNKNAGLRDANGNELPVKAKARLCIQGHLCPDSRSGQVQVDSPTIERVSTMVFLHQVISLGWVGNWYIGDISNAFLQGAPLKDKPDMFMRQPKQGLPGLKPGQLLKLLKPVYGRPDAPRAWYDELSRILETELGFSKCQADPAMFALRDGAGALRGLMIVHVDDVMIAHDGSTQGANMVEALCARFPFGTWMKVSEQPCGVSYCGKEIKLDSRDGEQCIILTQNAFIDGRLQPMQISGARAKELDCPATDTEKTDFRSVVGSLQWLTVQSRPDVAFECNQLQKRVSDLRVRDLLRANKAVKEVIRNRFEIVFKSLGHDAELVTFHDAGLYSSVGVELDERECEDLLQQGHEKKLVYSQKGACVGFVKRGSTSQEGRAHFNLIDWKSATNRRVVESSFAAETHGALMAQNMSRFAQVLLGEIRYGSEIISAVEDDGWQQLCPVTLVTDCRSIYDTVHKDGQHVGEKGVSWLTVLRRLIEVLNSYWWNDAPAPGSLQGELANETARVRRKAWRQADRDRLEDIEVVRRQRQLLLLLQREELRTELSVNLPPSFPLRPAQAEFPEKMSRPRSGAVVLWTLMGKLRPLWSRFRVAQLGNGIKESNALFKHLAEKCDPLAAKAKEGKERLLLVVGYLGSRYRCSAYQNEREEASLPSVEGALISAVRRAWGDVFLSAVRSARTDRGFHAAENVIILTLRPCLRDDAALLRELRDSDIRLLSPVLPVASLGPNATIFDKVYCPRRRSFNVYIPYWALVTEEEKAAFAQSERLGGVWFGPLHDSCVPEDVRELLAELGIPVTLEDIEFETGKGHVQVRLGEEAARAALCQLNGRQWHESVLVALPLSEALGKFTVHRRVRKALKELKGGPAARKGLRSYHNFLWPSPAPREPSAMRQLFHCSAQGLEAQRRGEGAHWSDADWTAVTFAAADFGPQQVRRMAGALVAVARGSEELAYIARCFEDEPVHVPPVPAEAVALEAVELGPPNAAWRGPARVDEGQAAQMRAEIERRVRAEAFQPWKDFLAGLARGATRSALTAELAEAARSGEVSGVLQALDRGALPDVPNEYGETATFLAALAGATEVVQVLASRRADLTIRDNAGLSPLRAAELLGFRDTMAALATAGAEATPATPAQGYGAIPRAPAAPRCQVQVTRVIPLGVEHAGAGTTVVDHAFDDAFLERLDELWKRLPLAPKQKASPTDRAYYHDVEGWLTGTLNEAVRAAQLGDAAAAMPHMRFLIYPEPGGSLPAHVDLSRTEQNLRSTYTFLLYLSDCLTGGETTFLQCLDGDEILAPSGGVAPGERTEVAAVSPARGRLLLMPHACPHLAAPVVEVPKVLVRGEVLPPGGSIPAAAAEPANDGHDVQESFLDPYDDAKWSKSFALFFKGVEDCPICYNVIQLTTQTIPRKACPTCKHKFHNECLYQWFRSSSKTTCPLCNQPF